MVKKIIILSLIISIITLGILGFVFSLNAAPKVNQAAVDYLKTKDNSSWKTMALVAANESGLSGDHLKNVSSSNAIDYCAPTLAITALDEDPRTFPNNNYVSALKGFWDGTQLGNASTLNDDIFGLLALISAGESTSDTVTLGIKNYLLGQQNLDGGWGFATGGSSDTNMTAMAIMALLEVEVSNSDPIITNAIGYLQSAQNNDGGFPYNPTSPWGADSDASSDAWVISAIYALGQDPETWKKSGNNPVDHLKSLQTPAGYFKYQSGTGEDAFSPVTTSYAVIALAGQSYPVNKITYTPTETFDLRIEGQNSTICSGQFPGPTALDIVKNAALTCGFTYVIEDTAFGPYLKKINDEEAQGLTGWLYFVNYISPMVGAADYILKDGDQALWYYGNWGWKPLKIETDQTEASSGAGIIATVKYFKNSWQILSGANVKVGNQAFTTDAGGQATLSLADGYYRLYAEKTGYVRSNKILVKFGEPASGNIGLKVNIIEGEEPGPPGPPPPDEISFSVEPDNINFGDLKPGQSASQNITITNTGAVDLYLESIVSGNDIFQDNLKLDNQIWGNWNTNISINSQQETELQLAVPTDYSIYGAQTGGITFWAIVD